MRVAMTLLAVVGCGDAPVDRWDEVPLRATAAVAPASPGPTRAGGVPGRWAPIDPASLPDGDVRDGYRLVTDTRRALPESVPVSALNCTHCHIGGGATPNAGPWVGVDTRYPKHRARSGKVDTLPDRVNDCMERSLNGRALPDDSAPMRAIVAYMAWLSEGVADGTQVPHGFDAVRAPEPPDDTRGAAVFAAKCAACHGADGQGRFAEDGATLFPPLWGPRSYNLAAGLARLDTAAAFIKWNMPQGQGGTLSDQEAVDVAHFVAYQDRPDFAGKVNDWPAGGKPRDARY